MWKNDDCKYQRFMVESSGCPMIKHGFVGKVTKEYQNTYLIELDMKSIQHADRLSLMHINEFNGRVIIAKKYVNEIIENSKQEYA
ncbi:hypothetical protein ABTQ33_10600 [Paucilactobacillus suebicus]|nr:hypothetical protein [Paucilactobacillus suebicus]